MMDQISKMAKKTDDEKEEEHQKEAKPVVEDGWRNESKEEYFDRVLKSSSSLDRVLEFLRFRKQADKLLPSVANDLVALVRRELEILSLLERASPIGWALERASPIGCVMVWMQCRGPHVATTT